MKKTLVFLLIGIFAMPAISADVSERMDCTEMQARINQLSAMETLDEAQSSELSNLQSQYRSNCSKSASGRRTSASSRVATATATAATNENTVQVVETVIITSQSVLNDYLAERKNLCEGLKTDMDTLTAAGVSSTELQPLQSQYNNDCNNIDKSKIVEIDAVTAAANVASGLCTDGSKPNQFGCCEGETFKDMGNLVFACCPDDGGECYPPITSGDAI